MHFPLKLPRLTPPCTEELWVTKRLVEINKCISINYKLYLVIINTSLNKLTSLKFKKIYNVEHIGGNYKILK